MNDPRPVTVSEALGVQAERLAAAANEPVLLTSSRDVFLVDAGATDVFAVTAKDGTVHGARLHLFRAEAGSALFGGDLPAEPVATALIAVPLPETALLRCASSDLWAIGRDPIQRDRLAELLDGWMTALSAGLPSDHPPHTATPIATEGVTELPAGTAGAARQSVVWVLLESGRALFQGRPGRLLTSGAPPYPLAPGQWVLADTDCRISSFDTSGCLAGNGSDAGFSIYQRFVMDSLVELREQQSNEANARLTARGAGDDRTIELAIEDLGAVLAPSREPAEIRAAAADPLLAACRIIGKAQGLRVLPPPRSAGEGGDRLEALARASHMHYRRILLDERWWMRDHGPLLAYLKDDHRPFALLPSSMRRYRIADPEERGSQWLNGDTAARLEPFGYVFYRPLPDRPLNALDLLRFCFGSAGSELRTILLAGLGVGLLGLAVPIATGVLFNQIIPSADSRELPPLALAVVLAGLAAALFRVTSGLAILRLEGRLDGALSPAIWDRLLSLPTSFFFHRYSAGELASRSLSIDAMRRLISDAGIAAILAAPFSIFSYLLLFNYSVQLAITATVLLAVSVATILTASYLQLYCQRVVQRIQGQLTGIVLQFLTGIVKLRIAGAEGRAYAMWAGKFGEQRRAAVEARTVEDMLTTFSAAFPIAAAMVLIGTLVLCPDPDLSTGAFVAFLVAFTQVLTAISQMGQSFRLMVQAIPSYERVAPILRAVPEASDNASDPGVLQGRIELSHVSFREAEGRQILEDVSIEILPGQFVALTGPSGSGKSTLTRLLLGFEQPASGAIYYDGQDLADLDVGAVRRQIGVVLQTIQLITRSIYTNIAGASGLTLDDAWEAARLAGFDQDVRDMPMGMQTQVMEGGSSMSGGQRQRLLIARALATRSRMFLMDEATSA